jgi:predicted RecA/RadA family phage recombinase
MKNFYQNGRTIPLTMTADVKSGQLIRIDQFVGVVAVDAKTGESAETQLEGVFILPKAAADAITQGSAVKFDPATGTITAAGTAVAGVATQAAVAGTSQVFVRLMPGLASAATMEVEARTEREPDRTTKRMRD